MSTTTPTNRPKVRRRHPARRARQITGVASVAGMVLLTGCMASGTTSSAGTSAAASSATATATATQSTVKTTTAAAAATPSTTAATSSQGS